MPKSSSEKCRLCSKLSVTAALLKHGFEGTGCWEGERCHKHRTYYRRRDRYNKSRRLKRQSPENTPLQVPITPAPAAVLYLYRERVDGPFMLLALRCGWGRRRKPQLSQCIAWA